MPKQVSSSDRTARTVRSAPDLIERVDEVAHRKRTPFNEVANAFFQDGIRMAALEDDVRDMLIEAGEIASRIMSARSEPLQGNDRLLNAERVIRLAVSEAATRRLVADKPMISTELWAGAIEVVEELNLSGEPWDIITSINSKSPPPSEADFRRINEALLVEAKGKPQEKLERLSLLEAYVDHAYHQHVEDWDDLKREARAHLDETLGISRRSDSTR